MTHDDVVIVGAGVVGCATASLLARRGARVAVFDAGAIASGASGRNAGLVEHPYDPAQEDLYAETIALLSETLGKQMPVEPANVLLLFDDEAGAVDVAAEKQRFAGLHPEVLSPDDVAALQVGAAGGLWACRLHTGYPVHPAGAAMRFADDARDRGVVFHTGQSVSLAWDGDEVCGVHAGQEVHRAEAVLVAAGAESSAIIDPSGAWRPVRPLWGVSLSLDSAVKPPQPLLDGRVASIQSGATTGDAMAFSLIPTPGRLALGSTFLSDMPSGADWVSRLVSNGHHFWTPMTDAEVVDVRVCARPRSFDGRPLLGRVAGQRRLWLAAGHGGRGISTGAGSARLVADALIAGADDTIASALRADRAGLPPVSLRVSV